MAWLYRIMAKMKELPKVIQDNIIKYFKRKSYRALAKTHKHPYPHNRFDNMQLVPQTRQQKQLHVEQSVTSAVCVFTPRTEATLVK